MYTYMYIAALRYKTPTYGTGGEETACQTWKSRFHADIQEAVS